MGRLRLAEASAFDLLEALDDHGRRARVTRRRFGEMARQTAEGFALTLRTEDGALAAVVGLWPEADHLEAWLAAGPALRANLIPVLKASRRALEAVAAGAGGGEVRCYVLDGASLGAGEGGGRVRVAGARIAAGLGFSRIGTEASPWGPVGVFSRVIVPEPMP